MKKRIAYIAIFAAIAISLFSIRNQMVTYSRQKEILDSLSRIDTAGIEPQVVKKIESLKGNLTANRKSADAWGLLAMNLDAHDLKKESIPIYKEAARLNPSDFRWPYF